jgi:hypothetical protein
LNWHVGLDHETREYRFGYQDLVSLPKPEKENKIAVICSDLKATEGQRERLRFLEALKGFLGDKIVHYGRGFEPIPDKFDAILPYAYHLVMENSRVPHYWSEKLADAYLGYAFPFYLGAPNLEYYFPRDAFENVFADQPEKAAELISWALSNDLYGKRESALAEARNRVLNDYNFFTHLVRLADANYQPEAAKREVRILSHKAFRPFPGNVIFWLKNRRAAGK